MNPTDDRSSLRNFSALDRIIHGFDQALRVAAGEAPPAQRPDPAQTTGNQSGLAESERRHAGGLMRVNHTGEVCAQALYAGQAATARTADVKQAMQQAADEELDHLAWCQNRLQALESRPSLFNPLWYAGSFAIGAVAGLAGDRWSLGFLRETERQVESHLQDHLDDIGEQDPRSAAILKQMQLDEIRHGENAKDAGGIELPQPVKIIMTGLSQLMKFVSYRL